MASLTRNAGVEGELSSALKAGFRRRLQDELGVPTSWTWEEADAEVARRTSIAAGALLEACAQTTFLALSRALANLEQQLRG